MADLRADLETIKHAACAAIAQADSDEALYAAQVTYLGKKGSLTAVLRNMGALSADERPQIGALANTVRAAIEAELDTRRAQLANAAQQAELRNALDVTLPGIGGTPAGYRHPIATTLERMQQIFRAMGFSIVEGPEVETEWYNFDALNMPASHPARDMQDTFYTVDGRLLRTHTSPVQIHTMQQQPPPIRMIAPGAVFRRDADITHSPMFHQVEGLVVDTHITFGDLKWLLQTFLTELFDGAVRTRFRPSFFPFTEPSAEVDIGYVATDAGLRVARGNEPVTKWMEILGCGMVDPAVFTAVGYDPAQVSGFAFGVGVERIAMLRLGIDDIRLLYENDLRFLQQVSS